MRLIDGDALKEAFYQKMKELLKSTNTPQISNEALSLLCGAALITEAPTIGYKKGNWIDINGDGSLWRCDQCKDTACCRGDYCPNCGADMRGENDVRESD